MLLIGNLARLPRRGTPTDAGPEKDGAARMTQQDEIGVAALASAEAPPPFDEMIRTHGAAEAAYRRLAWLLLLLGAAILALGFLAGSVPLAGPGVVVALTALISWKKSTEHAERAEGVAVLKDEWADSAQRGAADGLRTIMRDLYGAGGDASHAAAKSA